MAVSICTAKKPPADDPPPPEPTPAGTIYFQLDTPTGAQTWGMDGDGNNMFQALPQGVFGCPSSLLYGADAHRWFLVGIEDGRVYDRVIHADGSVATNYPHSELFALRWDDNGDLICRQVCDSYGKFLFPAGLNGQFSGPSPDFGFLIQWSSEGSDVFVYSHGYDISNMFFLEEDGTTTLDVSQPHNDMAVCRIDVPDSSMTLGQSVEADVVLPSAAITILPGRYHVSNVEDIQFAPNGVDLMADLSVHDETQGYSKQELQMYEAETATLLWRSSLDFYRGSRLSPLGNQVVAAMNLGADGEGIWVVPLDANGLGDPVPVFTYIDNNRTNTHAWFPRWSPDAQHVVFRRYVPGKGNNSSQVHILRVRQDGTGVVNLTQTLGDTSNKWPYRWVSNVISPAW